VSEKSTRNDLDYVFESRAARNRSVFATANAALVAQNPSGGYNSSVLAQKKEIPFKSARTSKTSAVPSGNLILPTFGEAWGGTRFMPRALTRGAHLRCSS